MTINLGRRSALRRGAVGLAAVLAGCGGGDSDATGTAHGSDPDAGTGSYGIVLDNESPLSLSVRLTVAKPFGEKPLWQQSPDVDAKSSRSWDSVVTKDEKQVVKARLLDHPDNETYRVQQDFASLRITPGSNNAPDVSDIEVVLRYGKDSSYAEKADLSIVIPPPGGTATPTP